MLSIISRAAASRDARRTSTFGASASTGPWRQIASGLCEALKYLPAAQWNAAEIEKVVAWFAARRGDDLAERNSPQHLTIADPTDFAAYDRHKEAVIFSERPLILSSDHDMVPRIY